MHLKISRFALLCCAIGSLACGAADDDATMLDRVEVTGSRISYRDLLDTPAISLTKQGDHLLLQFTLTNDSRDPALRKQELHATIEKLLARTAPQYQLLMDDAFRTPLDRNNYRVELNKDSKRSDVNNVTLHLRADVKGAPNKAGELIEAMQLFLKVAQLIGRTELDASNETALVMNRPERYRYDLIAAIAADTQRIAAQLGTGCRVELEGLNSRIEWERVSASELLLYVPYTMTVRDCGLPAVK